MDNSLRIDNWFIDQLNVYQSANSDYQSIKNNFIIRKDEFETIIESLAIKDKEDPLQHELVLGRRGSGKSTLLKRIEIEPNENNHLNNRYIPINLAEEQAGIYRLFDLWEEVIKELRYKLEITTEHRSYETFESNHEYTRYLYDIIHQICQNHNKRIVLLLDNFDRIVENFTDDGSLLRETLINYDDIQIVAGSTRMDEHFWRYDMPFYEFFRVHRLESLSTDEIQTLLLHWSETLAIPELDNFVKLNPGKIENIRILTDGLPRTIQFFIQMVLQKKESSTYDYLKKIMDNVSPLYQERLNSLPAQMRKTVLEMAFIWEACTTKQLVDGIKMESKLISANLTRLVEKGVVDKIETSKKQHLYRISERFFNMWLIITQGNPDQKRKAKWLSIFLESWYSPNDFKRLSHEHIENLKMGTFKGNNALIYSKALSQSKHLSLADRDSIINLTNQSIGPETQKKLIVLPKLSSELFKDIKILIEKEEFKKAIKLIKEIENEADGAKDVLMAVCKHELQETNEAEKYYLMAIAKDVDDALINLANLYYDQRKYRDAEKYYLMAFGKGLELPLIRIIMTYLWQVKDVESEKDFLLSIDKKNKISTYCLAWAYLILDRKKDAEKYYLLSIENGDLDAIYHLASLYVGIENYVEAEKYYLLSIDKGNLWALNDLAYLYYQTNKNNVKALELSNECCAKDPNPNHLETQIIVEIWNGLFNDVELRVIDVIKKKEYNNIEEFIIDLLVQQQKTMVLRLFQHHEFGKNLQEKYSVLYYVVLIINNLTEDNLTLRIPPELNSTVDDILGKIKAKQHIYGY